MLRLTEVKLALDHSESALQNVILQRLGIGADELISYTIFRRGQDARKQSAIYFVYTLDVAVSNEEAVLKRLKNKAHVALAPDIDYRLVTHARSAPVARPIVIGTGPCGIFAGLMLAQMGFRPIILERGKAVR